MSKKSCPFSYSDLAHENGNDFLKIQYVNNTKNRQIETDKTKRFKHIDTDCRRQNNTDNRLRLKFEKNNY